jgi:hypothetical protein
MIRYPHTTPWSPALGFAAVAATVATLAIAVVLPAGIQTPLADPIAANASQVSVTLERIDVASQPIALDGALVAPVGYAPAKRPG